MVAATRYLAPLREGGSLPAIVECDDDGTYVLKFRAAGQGPLALVAEIIAGEIGRLLGLRIPELVLMEVDSALGRNEPDQEVRELVLASGGLNLGMDYLPGSITFDPGTRPAVDPWEASAAVWFDAFVTNIDRTARNTNLLWWHRKLTLIDHGASLYFHHNWQDVEKKAVAGFPGIRDHVLLPWARDLAKVDVELRRRLDSGLLAGVLAKVPDDWLLPETGAPTPAEKRTGYVSYLLRRLEAAPFAEEAIRAHANLK